MLSEGQEEEEEGAYLFYLQLSTIKFILKMNVI